jgi:uncharacterized protein (TIGR00369 family)
MSGAERLAILRRVMDLPGFPKSSGMRVVSAEPGKVTMALAKRPELTQFFGHFHGGVIAGLADHAAGACATSSLPDGKIAVTVELKINYLTPRRRGNDRTCRNHPGGLHHWCRQGRGVLANGRRRVPVRLCHRHHARDGFAGRLPLSGRDKAAHR